MSKVEQFSQQYRHQLREPVGGRGPGGRDSREWRTVPHCAQGDTLGQQSLLQEGLPGKRPSRSSSSWSSLNVFLSITTRPVIFGCFFIAPELVASHACCHTLNNWRVKRRVCQLSRIAFGALASRLEDYYRDYYRDKPNDYWIHAAISYLALHLFKWNNFLAYLDFCQRMVMYLFLSYSWCFTINYQYLIDLKLAVTQNANFSILWILFIFHFSFVKMIIK